MAIDPVKITLTIKGEQYEALPRPSGWLLTKEGTTEQYFTADLGTCSCLGFQYRAHCKHVDAIRELGLTPLGKPAPEEKNF